MIALADDDAAAAMIIRINKAVGQHLAQSLTGGLFRVLLQFVISPVVEFIDIAAPRGFFPVAFRIKLLTVGYGIIRVFAENVLVIAEHQQSGESRVQ